MRSILAVLFVSFIILCCVAFVFSRDEVQKTGDFDKVEGRVKIQLPADFVDGVSMTNGKNGLMLGYYSKTGEFKAVQYSGADYKTIFVFEFVR